MLAMLIVHILSVSASAPKSMKKAILILISLLLLLLCKVQGTI